jgi:hypothetical protein
MLEAPGSDKYRPEVRKIKIRIKLDKDLNKDKVR